MLWIAFAVVFLLVLVLLKTSSLFNNKETYQSENAENGLTYNNLEIQDLVNRDTDGDGIPNWEEGLYGLDPTKTETTPGTPDKVAFENMTAAQASDTGKTGGTTAAGSNEENLTQTDKFSRELFATVAAASQNGTMDQASVEQLSSSLAEKIQNAPPRKIFLAAEIKTTSDNSVQAFTNYNNALKAIYKKYPPASYTILDVLQKFMVDENTVDTSQLVKLDPIILQTNNIIVALVKTTVPQSISTLHLNVINSLERLSENLHDIQLYDTDVIVALGGISKYEENSTALDSSLNNLANAINQKLGN